MSAPSAAAVRISRTGQTYLAALLTSVPQSRLFLRTVCSSWQLDEEHTENAALLISELAANAIQASGVTEARPVGEAVYAELKLIGVRLLELQDSLVIEVWDTSPKPPVLLNPSVELEHGRGLQLVNALSMRWGHYDARMGGKVVWCEISLSDASADESRDKTAYPQLLDSLQIHAWNEKA